MNIQEEREEAVRRLLQRSDVAEAHVDPKDGMIYYDDMFGIECGPFEDYIAALRWLVGDGGQHLTGMAVCPCLKCLVNR